MSGSSGGPANVSAPAGTEPGDLLVAVVTSNASEGFDAEPEDLWTPLDAEQHDWQFQLAVHYRVVEAGDATSYAFEAVDGGWTSVVLSAYEDVDVEDPFDDWRLEPSPGQASEVVAPSVTTTGPDRLGLVVFGSRAGGSSVVLDEPPAALTNRVQNLHSSRTAMQANDALVAEAGATDPYAVTVGTQDDGSLDPEDEWNIGAQIALRGASAGEATVTASWTPTPSTWASGYELERWQGGALEETITVPGQETTEAEDVDVPEGAYDDELRATHEPWRSTAVHDDVVVDCG